MYKVGTPPCVGSPSVRQAVSYCKTIHDTAGLDAQTVCLVRPWQKMGIVLEEILSINYVQLVFKQV